MTNLVAIDLGADSGRVVLGSLAGGRFQLSVVHRFANVPQTLPDGLHWDIPALWAGICEGLALARSQADGPVASIGIDTWGVDYALVDQNGQLQEPPWHYRDGRTTGQAEAVDQVIPRAELFARTGTRSLSFNTIYQLVAAHAANPASLARPQDRLLTIPDLFTYRLCGIQVNEWTNAGTTGLTRAGKPEWDHELIARLGLPAHLFGSIVRPGTVVGTLLPALAAELGYATDQTRVIVPGCHDTASAVAAMPTTAPGTAFISCGTWSLMGVLADEPATGADALAADLSNEIAVDGRIRLLQNIMGLWVWQECRRDLIVQGTELSHAELARLAAAALPAGQTFAINDPSLLAPSSAGVPMIDRVRALAGGLPTATPGELFRRITEALAAAYARCRNDLERVTGVRITALSLMGGGCRNELLCQLTADACGVEVIAGPDEGTALGNLLVQARSLGLVDAAGMADLAAASTAAVRYRPAQLSRPFAV